jgi:parallel beta-helix repeat protein
MITIRINRQNRRIQVRRSGPRGPAGVGVPSGGTTGQHLAKSSNEDYATAWVDDEGGAVDSVNGRTGIVTGLAEQTSLDTVSAAALHKATSEIVTGAKTFNAGTLLDKGSQVFDIRTYGATTAASDNKSAIQEAITAAAAVGGTVFVPTGVFVASVDIDVTCNIVGTGPGSVLKAKAANDVLDNFLKIENQQGLVVANLKVDGNRANQSTNEAVATHYGIYVSSSPNCRVDGVHAVDWAGDGIHIYGSEGVVVTRCHTEGNRFHGIEIEQTRNCIVSSCRSTDNDRHGIFIAPGEEGGTGAIGNVVTGNVFDNNGNYGISLGIAANIGGSVGLTRDNAITNNIVRSNAHYGVSIYRVDDTVVSGNVIEDNGFIGLQLYRAERNQVIGNRLHNNSAASNGSYDEIMLEGFTDGTATKNNLVANNTIMIDGSNKARYAIHEANAGDGPNVIFGNVIPNAGVSGRILTRNSTTRNDYLDLTTDQSVDGVKTFADGLITGEGSSMPTSGVGGIDAPFGTVGGNNAPLRIISWHGGQQYVSKRGAADWYISDNDGNNETNVMSAYFDHASLHNHKLTDVSSGTDSTDAVNKGQLESVAGAQVAAERLHAALANADARSVSMIYIGSSTTAGTGASVFTKRWMNVMGRLLHEDFNARGVIGGTHVFPDDSGWTTGGTTAQVGYGLGLRSKTLSAAATMQRTATFCTGFEVYYAQGPGQGAFTVTVDGGAPVTVTPSTAGSYRHDGTYTSGTLTRGSHDILITATAAFDFNGLYLFDGDRTTGVRAYNSGTGNATAATFSAAAADTIWQRAAQLPDVAAVCIMLGANDYDTNVNPATYKSRLLTIINNAKAVLTTQVPDFILINTYRRYDTLSPTYAWELYGQAMAELADEEDRVYYLDLADRYPATNTSADDPEDMMGSDNTHMNDAGHAFTGRSVKEAVAGRVTGAQHDVQPVMHLVGDETAYGKKLFSSSLTSSSGTEYGTRIEPTVAQSGTASYTSLYINTTQTSLGSGTKLIIDARAGGSSKMTLDNTGNVTLAGRLIGTRRMIRIVIDGGGSAITTGAKQVYVTVPYNGTITKWRLMADTTGSIVVDIWKDTYANFVPTVADTITASAKPTLSSAQKNESSTLTGWTTTVTEGDVIEVNVDSVATVTKVVLDLFISETA